MEPKFELKRAKHEPKMFQVTWIIKKKSRQTKNCTLLPIYLSQEGNNMNIKN